MLHKRESWLLMAGTPMVAAAGFSGYATGLARSDQVERMRSVSNGLWGLAECP
jgi:hypothetical protein